MAIFPSSVGFPVFSGSRIADLVPVYLRPRRITLLSKLESLRVRDFFFFLLSKLESLRVRDFFILFCSVNSKV